MKINNLKIQLLQEIISCEDGMLLQEIQELFEQDFSEVCEKGEPYTVDKEDENSSFTLSEAQEEELMQRYKDFREEGGPWLSWEDVKNDILKEGDL